VSTAPFEIVVARGHEDLDDAARIYVLRIGGTAASGG
jgi:hypothetical protein